MSKYKPGERVACYSAMGRYTGTVTGVGSTITVSLDNDAGAFNAHPKQLRKLRPRKRREWWLAIDLNSDVVNSATSPFVNGSRYEVVHVREVLPPRKERK
jgi:hypothetical protein